MFAVPTARLFGLALALAFLSGSFSGSPAQEKKGEEKKADVKKPDEKKADVKKAKSKLVITVPQDDAELKIEGKDTKPTGTVREFETPEVEVGKAYEYAFSVTWRPNNYTVLTRTLSIEFKGGEEIKVDLTKADVVRLGLGLGVDYSLTFSCSEPAEDREACGRCDACLACLRAFAENGLVSANTSSSASSRSMVSRLSSAR